MSAADGLLCWICPKCTTMGLVRNVTAGYCMQTPRRPDCPVPLTGIPIVAVSDDGSENPFSCMQSRARSQSDRIVASSLPVSITHSFLAVSVQGPPR